MITTLIWASATLIFTIFFCVFFNKDIKGILNRTESVGKNGLKTTPQTEQSKQKIEKHDSTKDLIDGLSSPSLIEREKAIREELKKKALDENSETARVLIKYLAASSLALNFEYIYRNIFGSQIFLLKTANENRNIGLHNDFMNQYFENVQKLFPQRLANWNLNNYLQFLFNVEVLKQDGNYVKITNLGISFLEWITRIGLTEKKDL